MNVIWEQDGGVGRITLNRPGLAERLDRRVRARAEAGRRRATPRTTSVRAVLITGAGRGFSSGADLKAGFDPHPDDGMPDIRKELARALPPDHRRACGGSRSPSWPP